MVLREIFIAVILIALMASAVQAQGWSSSSTSDITSVDSLFVDGKYIWTLHNNTSLPSDLISAFDVLVWVLKPFQVNEPLSWTAPEGWAWDGSAFALTQPQRKYYSPCALAPGVSFEFTYTPDPGGKPVNARGPQPERLGFITHIAAVVPASGSEDGRAAWTPFSSQYGRTWYDNPTVNGASAAPEPMGWLVMAMGVLSLGGFLLHCIPAR